MAADKERHISFPVGVVRGCLGHAAATHSQCVPLLLEELFAEPALKIALRRKMLPESQTSAWGQPGSHDW